MKKSMKKTNKIIQRIIIAVTAIPLVISPLITNIPVAEAAGQIPELTAYQSGNGVKLEWSIEMLDSDVLSATSFENGQFIPSFSWGSNGLGGQSITNEISQDGSRAYKVVDTVNNGNHYGFPQTSSNRSIMGWDRKFFENGTPLTISFYAKTDSVGTIIPYGDGGWANVISSYAGFTIAQTASKGSLKVVLSAIPSSVKVGSYISTDTDPNVVSGMYLIKEIDAATNTITLNTGINRDLIQGEVLKTRTWRGAWSFNTRTVYAEDDWKRFSVNTYVNNFADYNIAIRGGSMLMDTTTGGTLYIDNVKFGYAVEAVVFKDGVQLYRGMLSDFNDTSAKDIAKPNPVTNVTASMSENKPVISWTPSSDNGTSYSYTMKGVGVNGESQLTSPKEVTVTTGIKGYSVVFDQNPTTIPDNTIETTTPTFKSPNNLNTNYYGHITAIDEAGNISAPVHVRYTDTIAPGLSVIASNTNPTNQDITLTATANDGETGVKRVQKPDGTWVNGNTTSQLVSSNGTYTFVAEDNVGNQTTKTITVSNIDKVAPVAATLVANKTTPTNTDVSVTITYPSDSVTKQYKVGSGGSWMTYSMPVVLIANDTIYARSTDAAGNISAESKLVVNNIDKTPPVAATLSTNTTSPTNGNVTVTITYPADGVTKQYKIGTSGTWTTYTAPVVVTANETIYARSTDAVGNTSAESNLVISNIDKTPPVAATFVVDKTTPTNGNVNVTITYPSDAVIKQYRIGTVGIWTTYTSPVVITANETIYARSSDVAGNISAESNFVVGNIDKTPPVEASLVADKTTPTNVNVNVTINYPTDAITKQYKIGTSGTWNAYTSPVVISVNNTIYSRSIDAVGNISAESSLVISNIDKTAPAITLGALTTAPTNQNVTVTANIIDSESGIVVKKYASGNQAMGFFVNGGTTISGNTFVVSTNGTYTIYAKDAAGNESIKTLTITNIDKVKPTTPTAVMEGKVLTVTPGTDAESGVQQTLIEINGAPWTAYISPVTLRDGAYIIRIKTIDQAGNESNIATISKIVNVDALSAIERAENNMTQQNVDIALDLVNILPNSSEKQTLLDRLDVVQKTIDLENIEKKLRDIENQILGGRISSQDIEQVREKLKKLESETLSLPQYLDTKNAKNKMNWIKGRVDLIDRVLELSNDSAFNEIDDLEDLIGNMEEGDLKESLLNELNKVNGYSNALAQIEKAERSLDEGDVHRANVMVYQLRNEKAKSELMSRIDRVTKKVNAIKYVVLTESSFSKVDYLKARDLVALVDDSTIKNDLSNRLDVVIAVVETVDLVVIAEVTHNQVDIDNARIEVSKLKDGAFQDGLHLRLDRFDNALIQAQAKVKMAESNPTQSTVNTAKEALSKVFNSPQKVMLQERLNSVELKLSDDILAKKISAATQKVVQAEQYKRDPYISNARTAVDELPAGADKDALTIRINALSQPTEPTPTPSAEYKAAETKVKQAEMYKRDPYLTNARNAVDALPAGADKDALIARINALSQPTEPTPTPSAEYKAAETKVKQAEMYKRDPYLTNARNAVDALPGGADKDALIARLDELSKPVEVDQTPLIEKAENAIGQYEKYRLSYYQKKAQEAVDVLKDGDIKTSLQIRIDAVVLK
jgi:hypothetical protein